jgi:hypothetical protein
MSEDNPTPPQVKGLNCPNCGAPLTIRSFEHAISVVCAGCHTILDARDPNLAILQKFKVATGEDQPLIPLGTRGTIRGTLYEVVGFQRRTIRVEGIRYSWHEYLLFNPYKGFRYLIEYNGHWNDVSVLRALPTLNQDEQPPTLTYLGETYKHFQSAQASTSFVLGEFPWEVRVGETAEVADYISPPRVISSERNGKEITWSMGEYVSGASIWKAFKLEDNPPEPTGVYANQPSPFSTSASEVWGIFGLFIALIVVMFIVVFSVARNEIVLQGNYSFRAGTPGEASFVTDVFELKGHTSDLEVATSTNLDNNWVYLNFALINNDTGQAYDFGREISYYHGYDDGYWSEGGTNDSVAIPSVPPGNYYLRVEPESDTGGGLISYSIEAKRDVPQVSFFGLAILALLIPAGLIAWRSWSFEQMRWSESDHAPTPIFESGDDDD